MKEEDRVKHLIKIGKISMEIIKLKEKRLRLLELLEKEV